MKSKILFMLFVFSLLLAAPFAANQAIAWQKSNRRVVEVIADKDGKFKVPGQGKPVIILRPGEPVILRITAHYAGGKARDNSVHSFVVKKLRDEGWDFRLQEGTQDFPVVAPKQPGEYVAECTVLCGRGHDDMKLKVVITDQRVTAFNSNHE